MVTATKKVIMQLEEETPIILDVGAGTGRVLLAALEEIHKELIALPLDISEEMLSQLGSKLSKKHFQHSEHINPIVGDAHSLPIRAGVLSAILCHSVLHYLDWELAIAEFRRILKIGGRLLVTVVTLHDRDKLGWRNNVGQFARQPYFARFPSRHILREKLQKGGFVLENEEVITCRRKFDDLLQDKAPYFGEARIHKVIERYLHAPEEQKRNYRIDNSGFDQFHTVLYAHKSAKKRV